MTMNYYTSVIIIILLALIVLSILVSENNRIPHSKKRLFIATNCLIALAAFAECAGVHISGNPDIPKGVLAAVKAVDYTLTPMTGGALIALMEDSHKKSRLLIGIFTGNTILQIVSALNGWMVVIDDQNYYTHGQFYPVYMALYCVIIIIIAIKMLSYGKSFKKQNRGSLYATILLVFIGIGMQELTGWGCRVAYLAATFGSAFLYIHYSEFAQLRLDEKITEQQIKLLNDALTGVCSRFAYMEAIKAYAGKFPENFVVFLIDINGLKAVNDTIGHEAGDELICGAAQCIEASIGRSGRTFRIGGDEFVVFAVMTQQQIDTALSELKHKTGKWSGKKVDQMSLSVGYVIAKDHPDTSIENLVKEADQLMYEQKRAYYQISGNDRRGNRRR